MMISVITSSNFVFPQNIEPLRAVAGFHDGMTKLAQRETDDRADVGLIIDNKDFGP